MLIALGGLPGTGKTSIARKLSRELCAVHLRIDSIEQALSDVLSRCRLNQQLERQRQQHCPRHTYAPKRDKPKRLFKCRTLPRLNACFSDSDVRHGAPCL
ncbi:MULTISPECIES: AAA family ATPase [Burkholderiaceae]|uniref:AAA family ATPase n=1 Tax=Burkholderiaceae TaxID=119060 RepID=UPI000E5C34DD|nr:AAA family ATPase [Caballeronia sordidicola]